MTTLKEQLEEIKKRVEGATEGPWQQDYQVPFGIGAAVCSMTNIRAASWTKNPMCEIVQQPNMNSKMSKEKINQMFRDGDFIAHSRTDIPKLLRAVEVMLTTLQNLKAAHPASDLTWIMANDGIEEVKEIFEVKK